MWRMNFGRSETTALRSVAANTSVPAKCAPGMLAANLRFFARRKTKPEII
jgi:hypothetical protein